MVDKLFSDFWYLWLASIFLFSVTSNVEIVLVEEILANFSNLIQCDELNKFFGIITYYSHQYFWSITKSRSSENPLIFWNHIGINIKLPMIDHFKDLSDINYCWQQMYSSFILLYAIYWRNERPISNPFGALLYDANSNRIHDLWINFLWSAP